MHYILKNEEVKPVAYLNSDLAVLNSLKYEGSIIITGTSEGIELNDTEILEFEQHDEDDSVIITDGYENEFVIDFTTHKQCIEEPVGHNSFTDEIVWEEIEIVRVDNVFYNGISILKHKGFSKEFTKKLWNYMNSIIEKNNE